MKSNSKHRDDQRHGLDRALHHDQRIGLAGLLARLRQPLGVLAAVLELERSTGSDFGADLVAAFRIEQRSRRSRAARRLWWLHFGQTWRFFSRSVR